MSHQMEPRKPKRPRERAFAALKKQLLAATLVLGTFCSFVATTTITPQLPLVSFRIDERSVSPDAKADTRPQFQNSTYSLSAVFAGVKEVSLQCNGTAPVMWSLDSLEQPSAQSVRADRFVNLTDSTATETYSMRVSLKRARSQLVEEYDCHYVLNGAGPGGANANGGAAQHEQKHLATKAVIVWLAYSAWPFWNTPGGSGTSGGVRTLTWAYGSAEILIPCFFYAVTGGYARGYNVALNLYRVGNYSNSSSGAGAGAGDQEDAMELVWSSDPETASRASANFSFSSARFEPYVGFLINASAAMGLGAGAGSALYECRAESKHPHWKEKSSLNFRLLRVNKTTKILDPAPPQLPKGGGQHLTSLQERLLNYAPKETKFLSMTRTAANSSSVICCIKPGPDTNRSISGGKENVGLFRKECKDPLMCLTNKDMVAKKGRDSAVSIPKAGCRSQSADYIYTAFGATPMTPNLFRCHVRLEGAPEFGRWHTIEEHTPDYFSDNTENYYELISDDPVNLAMLTYMPKDEWNYYSSSKALSDNGNYSFYDGESARFHCDGPDFYFARGVLWELEWANGTIQRFHSFSTGYRDNSELVGGYGDFTLLTSHVRISCLLPPWNTTGWVSKTIYTHIRQVTAPTGPGDADADADYEVSVSFYVGQSVTIECGLEGFPQPRLTWATPSSPLYSFERSNAFEVVPTRPPPFEPRLLEAWTQPKMVISLEKRLSELELFSIANNARGEGEIPAVICNCTAKNVVGFATRTFRVQAIRPLAPVIELQTQARLFLHEANQSLVCSAKGDPNPELVWEKDGSRLLNTNNASSSPPPSLSNSVSVLHFRNVSSEDRGVYKCTATNLGGTARKEVTVEVVVRARARAREEESAETNVPERASWISMGVFVFVATMAMAVAGLLSVYATRKWRRSRRETESRHDHSQGDSAVRFQARSDSIAIAAET